MKQYLMNNDGGYKKLKVKGYIQARVTSSGNSRTISFGFAGYAKNNDGTRGSYKSVTFASLTVNTTSYTNSEVFEKEVNLEEFYFPNPYNQSYAPYFSFALGGTYGSITVYLDEMIWCK